MTASTKAGHVAPRVMVLMPVYSRPPYLGAAVERVLGQTYSDFELVIVDDGSLDGTRELAAAFSDPRIRLRRNSTNQELIASLDIGMAAARGKCIAWMDHDNVSLPGRLMVQVDFLDQHPEVELVSTGRQLIDSGGNPATTLVFPTNHTLIRRHW